MTKAEIIAHAARELGDTSAAFKDDIVKPAYELVMLELAQADALDLVESATFRTVEGQRTYEVREITSGGAHQIEVRSIYAFPWGKVLERLGQEEFALQRMQWGETATGQPIYWRTANNRRTIELLPPPNADAAGAELQVNYERNPGDIADSDTVTLVMERELPAIIDGIKLRCALFTSDTAQLVPLLEQKWEAAKARMRGRLHSDRPVRVPTSEGGW